MLYYKRKLIINYNYVADVAGFIPSYWVMFAALGYLLFYALIGSKVTKRADGKTV